MADMNGTDQWNDSTSFDDPDEACSANPLSFGAICFYCVVSLCFFVGAPAHSWCLWFYLRGGWRIGANQMFQVHHIIIELIMCVEAAATLFNERVFQNETLSEINEFISRVSGAGRPLIQACVCMEQYVAVVHPVTFLKYKAMRYKLGAVGAVYLISLCYGVYEIHNSEFPDPVFNSIYFIASIIIIFCCVSVLRALKRSGPGHTRGNRSTGQDEEDQRKKKAFKIISTNLLIMLITYVPVLVVLICYNFYFYYCVLAPIMTAISNFSLVITPLLKIYKEGYLKC